MLASQRPLVDLPQAQAEMMKRLGSGSQNEPSLNNSVLGTQDLGSMAALSSMASNPSGNLLAPTAPVITMQAPVQTPEFKEELATQVTILAREGIQEAVLELHPADMGPVSVHIALEGTQARVEFAVHSAVTKAILESGLADLASAMQNAGLTFAGADVSQGRSGARQESNRSQERGSESQPLPPPGASGSSAVTPPRTISARLGGLDLYA